jgi:hypothetical protein
MPLFDRRDEAIGHHEERHRELRLEAQRLLVQAALELGQASIEDVMLDLVVPEGTDLRCLGSLARGLPFLTEAGIIRSRRARERTDWKGKGPIPGAAVEQYAMAQS